MGNWEAREPKRMSVKDLTYDPCRFDQRPFNLAGTLTHVNEKCPPLDCDGCGL